MYETLALLGAFVFLYGVSSGGLERTPVNGAIVFTAFGVVFGPLGLDWLQLDVEAEVLRMLAELTLAVVLFSDAANCDLSVLRRYIGLPQRLLLIALPLTILLGFGTGYVLFDGLTLFEIAIIATMLAPTDAALGKAVVSDPSVPANIREGLNVESGLNDGICVPILFVFLALATNTGEGGSTTALALTLVAEEIGIGGVAGCGLTAAAVWLLRRCAGRGWLTDSWEQVLVAGLAVACFGLAQAAGGSGFIASFAGGLLFGGLAKEHKHKLLHSTESTGDTLALVTWVAFGAAVVGHSLDQISWQVVVYALLSLTVVRMLPVFLVLAGTGLRTDEKLFVGWFGPRGLASIVFGVIVLNDQLPGGSTITNTVVATIVLSVIGHGLSANPLVRVLAQRVGQAGPRGGAP
ncbi:MAG: cation:proton antiporter [Gammaproteobacteria bacterium]